uniref:Uncharacterized protein n=1 Tax=Arion vulgaris TaxID=1028688 RepID=A0A0B7BTA3_9EUPU
MFVRNMRTTKTIAHKLQTFINWCLRRIEGLRWYNRVTNEELLERTRDSSEPRG